MIDSLSVAHALANVTGIIAAVSTGLKPLLNEGTTLLVLLVVTYQVIDSKLRHKKTMDALKQPEQKQE